MKSEKRLGKRVVLGILLIGIMVVSISFVSASWKDWFTFGNNNGGQGELDESKSATATVSVSGTSNPPEILFVSNVSDATLTVGLETSEVWSFYFLVYSEATGTYLPPNGGKVAKGNVSIAGRSANDANCARGTPALVDGAAYGHAGDMLVNYTCDVTMWYYFSPGTWTINASVEDVGGNKAQNITKTFVLAKNEGFRTEPNPPFLNWTSVQLNAVPKLSNNEIKIVNIGNNDIAPVASSPLGVKAYRLNGTTVKTDLILASQFGASDVANCGPATGTIGTALVQNTLITINPFSALYSSSGPAAPSSNNLTLCLDTLSDIGVQSYNSTENQWTLEVTWDGT